MSECAQQAVVGLLVDDLRKETNQFAVSRKVRPGLIWLYLWQMLFYNKT